MTRQLAAQQARQDQSGGSHLTGGTLQRKCASCGNHTLAGDECSECRKKKWKEVQTKLKIGDSDDAYEREADRIADQVMAMPTPVTPNKTPIKVQRFSGYASGEAAEAPPSVERVLSSPGRPLPPDLAEDMGKRFGYDLSDVRIYSDITAAKSATDVYSRAYTANKRIVFGEGEYSPDTQRGKKLLVHELSHVLQQSTSSPNSTLLTRQPKSVRTHPTEKTIHSGINHALQRAILTGQDVYEKVNRDRIFEFFAHDIGYKDNLPHGIQDHVSRLGFTSGRAIHGNNGLVIRVFRPNKNARKRGNLPIIVFRGTEPDLNDIFDDLNMAGIGMHQFETNRDLIESIMKKENKADLTGHSLGGALSQLASVNYPQYVRRVITFQSPGIPTRSTRLPNVSATHYRVAHDIVGLVGEQHLPGDVYEFDFDKLDHTLTETSELNRSITAHTMSPLGRLRELQRGKRSLSSVSVTRDRIPIQESPNIIESFRHDVLGITIANNTPPQSLNHLITQLPDILETLRTRMVSWIWRSRNRINNLNPNFVFLLLEIIQTIYQNEEQVDMWIWILNLSNPNTRINLHKRLLQHINPHRYEVAPGMNKKDYNKILKYSPSVKTYPHLKYNGIKNKISFRRTRQLATLASNPINFAKGSNRWRNLNSGERGTVLLAMIKNYGSDFTKYFLQFANRNKLSYGIKLINAPNDYSPPDKLWKPAQFRTPFPQRCLNWVYPNGFILGACPRRSVQSGDATLGIN